MKYFYSFFNDMLSETFCYYDIKFNPSNHYHQRIINEIYGKTNYEISNFNKKYFYKLISDQFQIDIDKLLDNLSIYGNYKIYISYTENPIFTIEFEFYDNKSKEFYETMMTLKK